MRKSKLLRAIKHNFVVLFDYKNAMRLVVSDTKHFSTTIANGLIVKRERLFSRVLNQTKVEYVLKAHVPSAWTLASCCTSVCMRRS